jgi:predicted O-linked N-acetylglucosamine transferase (SPINDLY family)
MAGRNRTCTFYAECIAFALPHQEELTEVIHFSSDTTSAQLNSQTTHRNTPLSRVSNCSNDIANNNFSYRTLRCDKLIDYALHALEYSNKQTNYYGHNAMTSNKSLATSNASTPLEQALILANSGQLEAASAILEDLLTSSPKDANVLHLLGTVLAQQESFAKAQELLEQAATMQPKNATIQIHLGNVQRLRGLPDIAVRTYRTALSLAPSDPEAHFNLALVLLDVGEREQAVQELQKTIMFLPQHAEAQYMLGKLLSDEDIERAATFFRQALAARPGMVEAQSELILCLSRLGRFSEAERLLERAQKQHPGHILLKKQGAVLALMQGKLSEAEEIYRELLGQTPNSSDVRLNLGGLYQMQGKNSQALKLFEEALDIDDGQQGAMLNALANVKVAENDLEAAELLMQKAVSNTPESAPLAASLGRVLLARGDVKKAIEQYRKAITLAPHIPELVSNLIYAMHFDSDISADERFKALQLWSARFEPPKTTRPPLHPIDGQRKLRIGLLSGDFRDHPVMRGAEPLLTNYDHNKLEIFAYTTAYVEDDTTKRVRGLVDHWRQVAALPTHVLAGKIRRDQIDVLIDLSGHTAGNRLTALALGAAPLQLTWLGFFASTGLKNIDYRLTDKIMDPPGTTEQWHSEKLAYLPSPCCYAPPAFAPTINALPASQNGYVTFGALTQFNRYTDNVLETWKSIFSALPQARLKVFSGAAAGDKGSLDRIRTKLRNIGIAEERVEIQPWLDYSTFLKEIQSVDIALDPFPYPGGVTSMDALWMGIPTLTQTGVSSYQRIGASLMTLAGLPEFIAKDCDDYISKGIALGSDFTRLETIRQSLRQTLAKTTLIDGPAFAEAFTQTIESVWEECMKKKMDA